MNTAYPHNLLENYAEIVDKIAIVSFAHDDLHSLLVSMEDGLEGGNERVAAIARSAQLQLEKVEAVFSDIVEFCRAADVAREERVRGTVALAQMEKTDEAEAAETALALVRALEAICEPAMRACYALRDKAAEIDTMAARARELARKFHALDTANHRRPDKRKADWMKRDQPEGLSAKMKKRKGKGLK